MATLLTGSGIVIARLKNIVGRENRGDVIIRLASHAHTLTNSCARVCTYTHADTHMHIKTNTYSYANVPIHKHIFRRKRKYKHIHKCNNYCLSTKCDVYLSICVEITYSTIAS